MLPLLLIALTAIPVGDGVRSDEYVDMVEVNYVWSTSSSGAGQIQFVQYIFWEFDHDVSKWRVVGWRWRKKAGDSPSSYIDVQRQVLVFCEADELRRIRFGQYRVTSTNFDHETQQRKLWPKTLRKGLVRWKQ